MRTSPTSIAKWGSLLGQHMYQEAVVAMKRSFEMSRKGAEYPFYLARLAIAQAGQVAVAKRILGELPSNNPAAAAYVYAGLDERNMSIAFLNEASYRE